MDPVKNPARRVGWWDDGRMRDLLFLAAVIAFFLLAALFVRGCAWIIEAGRRDSDAR